MSESEPLPTIDIEEIPVDLPVEIRTHPRFEHPLQTNARETRLLTTPPWVRGLGKLGLEVKTEGWKFPVPALETVAEQEAEPPAQPRAVRPAREEPPAERERPATRIKPPRDAVMFQDRLLYLLQPPLESVFAGKQVTLPFKPYPYQMEGIAFLMPRTGALLADEMGLGKAQPLDARVLTQTGWKHMGEVRVGDVLCRTDGGTTRVIGVYPQGEKAIFRVEFSDGSATECCDDHLWCVNSPLRRWRGNLPRVLPLREIRQNLAHRNGNYQHFIPMVEPIEFDEQPLPLHPYLLGALLGDGCLAAPFVQYATTDAEMIERLRPLLPEGVQLRFVAKCSWNMTAQTPRNPLIAILRSLDLMPSRSETKFIPPQYLFSSVATRIALLQGLLDTDGYARPLDNNIEYCTVSPRLAKDVQFLVQSLGGTARIREKPTKKQLAYRMSVILPASIKPFALTRKANVYHPREKYPPNRAIVSVTPVGRKPCQCIAVDAPDHLYITDDFIVTHNTMQAILSLRLLFHTGVIRKALLVCPKPLVVNWTRELHMWAEDVPFEVIGGSYEQRKASWTVSNCPLKLVNYELLTRDVELATDEAVQFDIVVLDEAQRIKSRESKTAQVVRGLHRKRSWALTGTPIENRPEDLINIFAFVEEGRIPLDTPVKQLAKIAGEYILRRTKEDVLDDMPPKVIRDAFIELSPAQREAYDLAEKEGVIHLNDLGDTVTVQHVFELVMRLKQICNFDPRTGQSAKLEQLMADLMEVAESGRKAIVFSQWVEPLEVIARAVAPIGPLQYHGKISPRERQAILDQFKADPTKHVILMSYATGSVGLNLQFTNYVFLFDRWWNPAVEDQAINRAHRLGQKETVIVSRFITQGTIENRIAEVLEQKRALFNELIAQNGPPPSMGLTQKDIFGLFNIRPPRRQAA